MGKGELEGVAVIRSNSDNEIKRNIKKHNMAIRGERVVETQEGEDRKIYGKHIDAAIDFALAKIDKEKYGTQQAVYLATQAQRLSDREVFKRIRLLIETDVNNELADRSKSESYHKVMDDFDTDEQLRTAKELEDLNTTEEERMENLDK